MQVIFGKHVGGIYESRSLYKDQYGASIQWWGFYLQTLSEVTKEISSVLQATGKTCGCEAFFSLNLIFMTLSG